MQKRVKRIGVLTGGGDCPGLNAVLRALVRTADNDYNMDVVGFTDGFEGVVEGRYRELTSKDVSGILARGGTILGTSNRADPFNYPVLDQEEYVYLDRSAQAVRTIDSLGLDALIAIGGDGTMAACGGMSKKGVPIIGVPKTIDNDLWGTDVTFGFDSALTTATEAVDKIHTTAQSHHRVMIIEVMGRYAGWLALYSGIAGGGDIVLIPEIPYDIEEVCSAVRTRNASGKNFSIVVVGEGAKPVGGDIVIKRMVENSPDAIRLGGVSHQIAAQIEGLTNLESRVTILGHLVRGGAPSAADRILATKLGAQAVHLAAKREFDQMVAIRGGKLSSTPISEVAGKMRLVTPDDEIVRVALSLGISLGSPHGAPIEKCFANSIPVREFVDGEHITPNR